MNSTIKKLSDHASAQARVRIDTDNNGIITAIHLISYTTRVITIEYRDGGRFVECTGTYSLTTSKHITWFCREYMPDKCYYDMRAIAGAGFVAA